MATQASSAMALPQAWQPEQVPASLRLAPADPAPAEQGDNRLRPLEVAECCMCGIERPLGLLVPDGGGACADIRWYCKDVKSCTERWTAALPDRDEGADMPLSGCVRMLTAGRPAPDGPRCAPPGRAGGVGGCGGWYHGPFGPKIFGPQTGQCISGGPSGTGLPPVPAWAAPKNR